MKRYCVTGINRLTGEREIISPPCSYENANTIRARLMATKPQKRAYTRPQTAEYPKQLNLFTNTLISGIDNTDYPQAKRKRLHELLPRFDR